LGAAPACGLRPARGPAAGRGGPSPAPVAPPRPADPGPAARRPARGPPGGRRAGAADRGARRGPPTGRAARAPGAARGRAPPGAHLQLRLPVAGREQTRSYSLVGLPGDTPGAYRIAVKRLDAGRGGSLALWALAEGDALAVSAPQNHFPLSLDAPMSLLVAGG